MNKFVSLPNATCSKYKQSQSAIKQKSVWAGSRFRWGWNHNYKLHPNTCLNPHAIIPNAKKKTQNISDHTCWMVRMTNHFDFTPNWHQLSLFTQNSKSVMGQAPSDKPVIVQGPDKWCTACCLQEHIGFSGLLICWEIEPKPPLSSPLWHLKGGLGEFIFFFF